MVERDRTPVLFLTRMGLIAIGTLMILPAGITKSPVFAYLAAGCLLFSALLFRDSIRRRRTVAALLPPMVGFFAAAIVAGVGFNASWTPVPELAGAALILFLAQLVWNMPQHDRSEQHLAETLARLDRQPPAER